MLHWQRHEEGFLLHRQVVERGIQDGRTHKPNLDLPMMQGLHLLDGRQFP